MNSNLSQESDWQEVGDLALLSRDAFPWPMNCWDWSLLQRRRNEVGADWRRLSGLSFAAWVQQAGAGPGGWAASTHTPYSDSWSRVFQSSRIRSSVLALSPSPQPSQCSLTPASWMRESWLSSRKHQGLAKEPPQSRAPPPFPGLWRRVCEQMGEGQAGDWSFHLPS